MIAIAGQTPPLARQLGLGACVALVMGNMIGSGVYLLPASLAPYGWNAVGGWLVAICGTLALALVFARLGKALPEAGGAIGFVDCAFGRTPAFLVSWIYLVSTLTTLVTLAVAAVSYLSRMIPAIAGTAFVPAILASGLIWAMTLVNLRGVRQAGLFQEATTVIKIVPLVLVIALAALALGDGTGTIARFEAREIAIGPMASAAALCMFALLGFECASLATDRVRNPERTVPRAMIWGSALTGLLYLLVSSTIGLMLPREAVAASPAPFATFIEAFWSPGPAELIAIFAIVSCVGALNGWTLIQAELVRTMGADRLLPSWFGETDARGVARRALLVSAAVATLLALMNASRGLKELFEFLLLLTTSANLWFYLACSLAAIRLGVARPLAAFGLVFSLGMLGGAGIVASGLSLVLMVGGLPLYWWTRREAAKEPAGAGSGL